MGQQSPLPWGNARQTAHLVETRRSGEKESGPETGHIMVSPEQEKRSLHQEWCFAI
jgi:hypothetical protein